MSYLFHPEAEIEFNQAIEFYESCETGLGYDFTLEVYSAVELIITYPKAWPIMEGEVRRSLVKRFSIWNIIYGRRQRYIRRCSYEPSP